MSYTEQCPMCKLSKELWDTWYITKGKIMDLEKNNAELLETLKAVRTLLLQNRALGLCQGTEYVYIVDKVEQAISKAELK